MGFLIHLFPSAWHVVEMLSLNALKMFRSFVLAKESKELKLDLTM